MKKMFLLCLLLVFKLFGIIEYIGIIETPESKSLNLLGVDHAPRNKIEELDSLIERLKIEEQKGKIKILVECAEKLKIFDKTNPRLDREVLSNLRSAALEAGIKEVPEDIEVRKLSKPWQTLFGKDMYPNQDDFPLTLEKEIYETEDDPSISFDPIARYELFPKKIAQEVRNAYKRCLGKNYNEVMYIIRSCNLPDLTWQHVLDEFSEHENHIFQLWDSMSVGPEKDAFKKEIERHQQKNNEALNELKGQLKPTDRLLDYALERQKQGDYQAICHRMDKLGVEIFASYFDLNLIHKVLTTKSDTMFKTFIIAGRDHTRALERFLLNAKLGYKYLLGYTESDEHGRAKTLDDKYFDCLTMSLWELKYFPVSWLQSMIFLRKSIWGNGLAKLFYQETKVAVKKENHLIDFLKEQFPMLGVKLEKFLPKKFEAMMAIEPEDVMPISHNAAQENLDTAYAQLTNVLKKKEETQIINMDIFLKINSLVKKAYHALNAKVKLKSNCLSGREANLQETYAEMQNAFKEGMYFILQD